MAEEMNTGDQNAQREKSFVESDEVIVKDFVLVFNYYLNFNRWFATFMKKLVPIKELH